MEHQNDIRAYVLGRLSEAQKTTFETRMSEDKTLQDGVALYKNLHRVGKLEDTALFRQQLSEYDRKVLTASKSSQKIIQWLVAAILIVGVAVPSFYFYNQDTPQDVFAENFSPYRNVIAPIERNNTQEQTLQQSAFAAYEKKDFKTALGLFKQLYKEGGVDFAQFYIGNCQLALRKTDDAIASFTTYINLNGSLKDRAQWYLSLCYLAKEEIATTTLHLEKIVSEKSYNHQEAVEILKKIK